MSERDTAAPADFDTLASHWDVLVIGAGPAGLTAAATLAAAGRAVLVLDEQLAPGGQIYRAVGQSPLTQPTILGADYWRGREVVARFARSGARALAQTSVWQIDRFEAAPGTPHTLRVAASSCGRTRLFWARDVVLAGGAMERPFPIPGWTRPGVMGVGAAQVLLKTTGAVPQRATLLAGCGPLLWLYAAQVLRAGGHIDALLDTTAAGHGRRAWPHAMDFLRSPYWRKGLSLMAAVRRRVRVIPGVRTLEALGAEGAAGDAPLSRVVFTRADGVRRTLPADTLLLHQGVVPNTNLASALGCRLDWDDSQLCWVAQRDRWGQSSLPHVYIAGDGGGIGGARAAEAQGELAGWRIAERQGAIDAATCDARARGARSALRQALRGRRFLETLYRPADALRLPQGDTVVCRCEEVSARQVIDAAQIGCSGPNQLKAFLRCGMGPCQGRFCGLTVAEMLARHKGRSVADTGYYTLRFPTKPLTLAELAALPATDAGEKAVVTA